MDILKISQFITPTSGFFSYMAFDFEYATKVQLDILFYSNYGDKNPAPIVTKNTSLPPTVAEITALASMAESLYGLRWSRLKAACKLTYDPIHNYRDSLTETIEDKEIVVATEALSTIDHHSDYISKEDTRTDNLSETSTTLGDSSTSKKRDDGVYGFNSSAALDSETSTDTDIIQATGTDTVANTGTQKNAITGNNIIEGTKTGDNSRNSDTTNNKTRTSVHEGNIGNLTTQQLMKQELELWKWNFMQSVLDDLKEFLTIPIYLS